jgi:Protein of unknown function (DUF3987)
MVEDTESPRLFHVWSAISALAGSLGRRCFLPFGPMVVFPNHYILIVGTPGTRKSTAAAIMKRPLRTSTGVRFAPQDTAGQRQGLVLSMQNSSNSKEFIESVELTNRDTGLLGLTLSEIAEITNEPTNEMAKYVADADKHHIMVVSGEFSRFIGQNNLQMLDFLTTMYDGDDYEYKTKTGEVTLKNPLINLIGCTTPASIATSMPPAAGGQGFLSRIILVYGARKYKSVPRPTVPAVELVNAVKDRLANIYYELAGTFSETPDAKAYSESLYDYPLDITDSRFGYYNERRYTHLLKLAMCLCGGRGSLEIVKDDYEEAHKILRATEKGMPDALGEFGMNPLAAVKQLILDKVRSSVVIDLEVLKLMFHRDARAQELQEVINDLIKLNQIQLSQKTDGRMSVHAVQKIENIEDAIMQTLSESD